MLYSRLVKLYNIFCTVPESPMDTLFGKKKPKRMGKAQAREQFAPLIESLSKTGGTVEVTDYGKVAAVIMSYKEYLWLKALAKQPFKPKRQLWGSGMIVGEVDEASLDLTELIEESLERTAREL